MDLFTVVKHLVWFSDLSQLMSIFKSRVADSQIDKRLTKDYYTFRHGKIILIFQLGYAEIQ